MDEENIEEKLDFIAKTTLGALKGVFTDNSLSDREATLTLMYFLEIFVKLGWKGNNPINVLEEVYSLCDNDAEVIIRVPHFSSINVWVDLEHKREYSIFSFDKTKFYVKSKKIEFGRLNKWFSWFANLFPEFYEKHLCYIIRATDIEVKLGVIK